MKIVFKILGLGLAVLVTIGVVALVIINTQDIPSYEVEEVEFQRSNKPEAIARRAKAYSDALCKLSYGSCHRQAHRPTNERRTGRVR